MEENIDAIRKRAQKVIDAGTVPLAQLEETMAMNEKLDALLAKEISFPEQEAFPEFPEAPEFPSELSINNLPEVQKVEITNLPSGKDDTEQVKLLQEILAEAKKKEEYAYDIEIDASLKEKLKGKDGKDGEAGEDGSPDTPEEIATKINTLEEKIEVKTIKGLRHSLEVLSRGRPGGGGAGVTRASGGKNITVTPADGRGDVTITNGIVLNIGSQASASANTTLIQNALNNRGDVYLIGTGIAYVNATMITYSNTTVHIASGLTLKMIDGGSGGIFANRASRLAGVTVPRLSTTWVSIDGAQNYGVQLDSTGIGANFAVGDYVAIVATGHLTSVATATVLNKGFRGVWRVRIVSADSITCEILLRTPNDGNSNRPGTEVTVYQVDTNITYTGGGTLDGNGANLDQSLYGAGDPKGVVIYTRNAQNVRIDGLNFSRGISWTIASNYVRDYKVLNITGDSSGGVTGDFVHLVGQHQQVVIDNLSGKAGDNMVGCTIDITDDTSNSWSAAGNTALQPNLNPIWNYDNNPDSAALGTFKYNFPYQFPGDMYDISVSRVTGNCINSSGAFAICGIYGPETYSFNNMSFDDISGTGSSAFQLSNYGYTGLNNTNGSKLRVTNLHAKVQGAQLALTVGTQNWDSIVLDDVIHENNNVPAVNIESNTGTIGTMTFKNVGFDFTGANMLLPFFQVVGNQTINNLDIMDTQNVGLASGIPLFLHSGTGSIGRLSYKNVSATSAGGAGTGIHTVTGAGASDSLAFDNVSLTSVGGVGSMFSQGSTGLYKKVTFSNSDIDGASGFFSSLNTTTTANVFMNNVTLKGSASAYAGVFYGPTNLFVDGYNEVTSPSNNPFAVVTSGKAYSFKLENVSRLTDSIAYTAGNLRVTGGGARTNGANINAAQPGDTFYNTSASALDGINSYVYNGADIALVGSTTVAGANPGGTSAAVNTTGADLLVISSSQYYGSGLVAPTDNKGNTWIKAVEAQGTTETYTAIYYAKNPIVGAGHTFTGGAGYQTMQVAWFSGVDTTSPLDRFVATANSLSSGAIAVPTSNRQLVIATLSSNAASTYTVSTSPASSMSILGQGPYIGGGAEGGALAYYIQTTATAINSTWVSTGETCAALATFRAGPAGAWWVLGDNRSVLLKGISKSITYNGDGTVNVITDARGTKTIGYTSGVLTSMTGTGVYKNKTYTYSSGQLTDVTVS